MNNNEITPEEASQLVESVDSYWHLFAEKLQTAEPGTEDCRIAWRNYMLSVFCKASESGATSDYFFGGQTAAVNQFYNEGLQLIEPVIFTSEEVREIERKIYTNLELREKTESPKLEVELLRDLHEGIITHHINTEE